MGPTKIFAALLIGALAALPSTADAQGPDLRLGVGVSPGFMLNTADARARSYVNPLQLGFAGTFGVTLGSGLHLGAVGRGFLGQRAFDATGKAQQFAAVLGYAISVEHVVSVIPGVELGVQRYAFDRPIGGEDSDIGFLAAPGVELIADVSDHFWLGGTARVGFAVMGEGDEDIHFGDGPLDITLVMSAQIGARF
jgi:hypothetical protein